MIHKQLGRTLLPCSAIMLALAVSLSAPAAGQVERESDSGGPSDRNQPLQRTGVAYLELMIPRAITPSERDTYGNLLALSVAQEQIVARLYEEYVAADQDFRHRRVKSLWDTSAEVAARGSGGNRHAPDVIAAKLALMRERDEAVGQLRAIDRSFFDAIVPYLTDEQAQRLPRVERHRERRRCQAVLTSLPGGNVDLAAMLEDLKQAGHECHPRDEHAFDALMVEYELALTQAMTRAARIRLEVLRAAWEHRARAKQVIGDATSAAELDPNQYATLRSIDDARTDLYRRRVNADARVVEVNETYLDRIAAGLEGEAGAALLAMYRCAVYPVVHPDPYSLDNVLAAVRQLETLSDEQVLALEAMAASYDDSRSAIEARMESAYRDWRTQFELRSAYSHDEYAAYQHHMQALQDDRKRNAETTINQVKLHLTTAQFKAVAGALDAYRAAVKQYDEHRAELEAYGMTWPGPTG